SGVERAPDTVPRVVAHDAVSETAGVALDGAPDDVDRSSRGDGRDAAVEGLAGALDEVTCLGCDVSHEEGRVEVTVHAVVVGGDVDVDDVAVDEGGVVGDAVADHFVDGGAARFGEATVSEGR